MKALVLDGVNLPLAYKEVADPVPGAGEVVVAIKAAALNHRDLWIQKGQYAGLKFPIIPGSDGCGEVVECGADVDASWRGRSVIINPGFAWGERPVAQADSFRILGLPDDGTFAEKVKVPAVQLAPKPAHLDLPHAAALPLAGLTAYRALFSRAVLREGERVLITGVGGGAALFALQYAVAAGGEVYVTSSSDEKIASAAKLGAAGGANYKQAGWDKTLKQQAGSGFDVIVDSAGGEGFSRLIDLASPGGRIVFFGATRGDAPGFALRKVFWKQLSILGTTMGSPEDFNAMVQFVEKHRICPVADRVFPISEGNAALAAMDAAEQFGKIVLTV